MYTLCATQQCCSSGLCVHSLLPVAMIRTRAQEGRHHEVQAAWPAVQKSGQHKRLLLGRQTPGHLGVGYELLLDGCGVLGPSRDNQKQCPNSPPPNGVSGLPYLLDPATLETKGKDTLNGALNDSHCLAAHFRYDAATDRLVNFRSVVLSPCVSCACRACGVCVCVCACGVCVCVCVSTYARAVSSWR